jgi:hypothetical protein
MDFRAGYGIDDRLAGKLKAYSGFEQISSWRPLRLRGELPLNQTGKST